MTRDELSTRTATFASRAEAQAAADAAMPRRIHNRPYPIASGYHWAQAGRPAHDVYIVHVGNALLLDDGTMYDHQRRITIGR